MSRPAVPGQKNEPMLRCQIDLPTGLLVLASVKKVTRSDLERLTGVVEACFEKRQTLRVLVCPDECSDRRSLVALLEHLRLLGRNCNKSERIALVTDSSRFRFVSLVSPSIQLTRVRRFSASAQAEARTWLTVQ